MKQKPEPTREEIIGFLQRAADDLERGKPGTVLHWLGERLRMYLDGEFPTVQQALGLPPGRPEINRARNIYIAIEMKKFRLTPAAKERGAIKKKQRELAIAENMKGTALEKTVTAIERRYAREVLEHLNSEKLYRRRHRIFNAKTKR